MSARTQNLQGVKLPATRHEQTIPFLDLTAQHNSIRNEIESAVARVLESQRFILGPEVEAFEQEIAEWNGSRYAISCASGSDALLLVLMALGVGPGDEVITAPFTFVATATAIARLGARPVFVDINERTYNFDASQVQAAITPRTRAIIPIHLFGCPADLDPILTAARSASVPVIEDAAQAVGARYCGQRVGNSGTAGCFSFYPTKNLGCAGDGGLITTNDDVFAQKLKLLRNHGSPGRYSYETIGINSRLDALQAAILRVKLRHLNAWTEQRRLNASLYAEFGAQLGIETIVLPHEPDYADHVYNQFTVRSGRRDALRSFLSAHGVPTEVYYPLPLHLEPAFAYLGYQAGDFPECERACREVASLPIYGELPPEHIRQVVESIADFEDS